MIKIDLDSLKSIEGLPTEVYSLIEECRDSRDRLEKIDRTGPSVFHFMYAPAEKISTSDKAKLDKIAECYL